MSRSTFMPNSFATIRDFSPSRGLLVWLMTLAALVPFLFLLWRGQFNVLASAIIFFALILVSVVNRNAAICITFVYLFLLGDIRRMLGVVTGFPILDTLLVVGPAVAMILAIPVLLRLRLTDTISKFVFALMIVMTLEIFNPRQGPIVVGISGALFYLIPILWFWVGREYGTETLLHNVIYRVVIPLGVLAAVLGICQSFIGFLPWEQQWINAVSAHYHSLSLAHGVIRPFGFFSNSVEYSSTLQITCICLAAAFFAGKRSYAIFFIPLLTALFLSSSRSAVVKFLFASAVIWAVSNKNSRGWAIKIPLGLGVGIGVLAFSLSHFAGDSSSEKGASAAQLSAQHQAQGLTHPFDKKYSTAGVHSQMFLNGIKQGFLVPIGNGLGSATLGSGKFGGDESTAGSSEVDISDIFITLGAIGGLIYLALVVLVLYAAFIYARKSSASTRLVLLGMLVAMGGAWLALGQYATTPMIWFCIGTLSHFKNRNRVATVLTAYPSRTTVLG